MALTEKQRRFAEAWLLRPNKTRAAIKAGCPKKSAHAQGHRLFEEPEVKAYIKAEKKRRRRKYLITEDRIMKEMARAAFSNVADFTTKTVRDDGTLGYGYDYAKLFSDEARSIQSMKFGADGSLELKLHHKVQALRLIYDMLIDQKARGVADGEHEDKPRVVLYLPDNESEPKKRKAKR